MSRAERMSMGVAGFELSSTDRLKHLVVMAGGPTKAAEVAGVSRNALHDWTRGKTKMPLSAGLALAREAGVTLDWVATGWDRRPDMMTAEERPYLSNAGGALPAGFVGVPPLVSGAAIGETAPVGAGADHFMVVRESWLRSFNIAPSNAQILVAAGDNMEKTIADGDLLLVDRGVDTGRPQPGFIYVFTVAGVIVVKRLQILFDGSLLLTSDNQVYPPETIPPDRRHELAIEGRVRWFGRVL